ncbi:uncharacterized protein LOC131929737 [Physella acuta]|uniref:uncharacterized protein LOC131929737 n=1 Tax=Physella acuta TaxID=109671 RepID=UPI0027DD3EA4|nr:uncharacterized protein LOC131929737 [Physella acuta]
MALCLRFGVVVWLLLIFTSADATDFDKVKQWLGVGYDLVKANPAYGNDASQASDPGFHPTRRILHLSNPVASDSASPEVEWVPRATCSNGTVEKTIFSGKSYQQKLLEYVHIDSQSDADILSVAFVESDQYKRVVRDTDEAASKLIHEIDTQCTMGTVRYKTELLATTLIDTAFAHAVCALPTTYASGPYLDFIKNWGTHAAVGFNYGYAEVQQKEGSRRDFIAALIHADSSQVQNTGPVNNYTESFTVKTEIIASYNVQHLQFGEPYQTLKRGDSQNPEPIDVTLLPISEVLTKVHWETSGLPSDCPANLATLLPQYAANLKTATTEYAKTFVAPSAEPATFVTPLSWPASQFGLFKPLLGCSSDGVSKFESGVREFSTETTFNNNKWSAPLHLAGEFNKNKMTNEFCVKAAKTNAYDWPKGSYCIHRYSGACPTGFTEGWVKWDDEDGSDNHNNFAGTVPDGDYTHDTRMLFCCRMDGPSTFKILLPNRSPFFLLRFGGKCQEVYGMDIIEEWEEFDTEDTFHDNADDHHAPYPDDGSLNNIKFILCYYQPSSNMPTPSSVVG